jgi:hypothetical protein
MNSQARVQSEINLHKPRKKAGSANTKLRKDEP